MFIVNSSFYFFYIICWKVLAFRDISPQAPTHIVIIPKVRDGLTGLSKVPFNYFFNIISETGAVCGSSFKLSSNTRRVEYF